MAREQARTTEWESEMKNDNLGDFETCSVCLVESLWSKMTETDSGNICQECRDNDFDICADCDTIVPTFLLRCDSCEEGSLYI